MAVEGVSVGAIAHGEIVYMTPVSFKVHSARTLEEQNPI